MLKARDAILKIGKRPPRGADLPLAAVIAVNG